MPVSQSGFTKYSIDEFETWIPEVSVNRAIKLVQQHHTFLPDY